MKFSPAIITLFFIASCSRSEKKYTTWNNYGGSKENIHYSSLTQIDTGNVAQLQVAWEFHTGDSDRSTQIQTNAIIIDSILYGVSPKLKLLM